MVSHEARALRRFQERLKDGVTAARPAAPRALAPASGPPLDVGAALAHHGVLPDARVRYRCSACGGPADRSPSVFALPRPSERYVLACAACARSD